MKDEGKGCPCKLSCNERREVSVRAVLERGILTANEVRSVLTEAGFGVSATRRNLEFLSSAQCKKIEILRGRKKRIIQFKNQGRVYIAKWTPEDIIRQKTLSLLSPLQMGIIQKLRMQNKRIYYFSGYELRKLLPFAGFSVICALNKLIELRLVKEIKAGRNRFYLEPKNAKLLRRHLLEALVKERTEYEAAKKVHELVMEIYPKKLLKGLKGTLRPREPSILKITGGMAFDIFYELNEPPGYERFVAIDVYTRIPVNGYVVNSFLKKIDWASGLSSRTFGIIVFKNANRKAFEIANRNGINFLQLSKLRIDFQHVQEIASYEVGRRLPPSLTSETSSSIN